MNLSSSRGQSLVSTLVSIGITSIVIAVMSTMFSNQQKETRALTEKLASLDFMRMTTGILANPAACGAMVNNVNLASGSSLTFDPNGVTSTNPLNPNVIVNLKNIYNPDGTSIFASAGAVVSTLTNNLLLATTNGVQITGYKQGASINYQLTINFDQSKLARALHPLALPVILTTAPSGSSLNITGCQGSGGGGGSGVDGAICGNRMVACGTSGAGVTTILYDNVGIMGAVDYSADNIPCQGVTLTGTCFTSNFQQKPVADNCPAGYAGARTLFQCINNQGNEGILIYGCMGTFTTGYIGVIYCRKN